ncbi:MAG: tandem-95 repeat protein, partial [Mariniphaga sp.]|nr:tandem-95 repeat protein [Mariniphaga sp.]
SVAPGTPAGNYTLTYKICEKLNPANCDQASVSVPVSAAVIDAVDGSGTVNGMTGGTTIADVLYNDLINGELVHHSEVNLSFVSSTNPNVTLNTTTGAVNVAPGTVAGTYYVTYKICEILNPANCDEAVSTAIVTAAPILAANDAGNAYGMTGGTAISNVLSNDLLNGSGITLAKINLTVVTPSANAGVVLNTSTGEVIVSPQTQAGTYQITYQVCEKLNPTNCDQAIATITVAAASIQAKADAGFGVNGYTGGSSVSNVLANDLLNGSPLAPSDAILSFVSSSSPNITLNGTEVLVAPATPAGTYTLDYSICEKLNPSNCDVNTVTVIVTAPLIDATPDEGTANGMTGGTAVNNVLANDLLNGVLVKESEVNTTFISSTNSGITLAGTSVIVAPGTAPGTYKLNYQICEKVNVANCDETTVAVTVTEILPSAVNDLNITNEDTPVQGDVSTNDTRNGYGGNVWSLVGDNGGASHGIVALNPQGTYTYVPDPNYHGTDAFNYQLCDAFSNCSTAIVNITINSVRDFPLAENDVNSTDEDMPVTGNVSINDTQSGDGGNLWSLVGVNGGVPRGSVTMNPDGTYFYIPANGDFGEVSFYYQLCDTDGDCSQAIVTITILNDMDGIAALNDVNTTLEDTPVNGNVSTNDTPSDEGTGVWKLSGINGGATHGTVAMNLDGNYRYIPDANYFGTDLFNYQQCDLDGDCVSATVTITITAVNDPPLALNDAATTNEDTPVTIAVTANDSDIDGTIKVSTVDLDTIKPGIQTTFIVAGQGTYSVDILGIVTFTPVADFNGLATPINYVVQDDKGATSNIATITINITPVPDPPVAINDNFLANENQKLEENLLENDYSVDGNVPTIDNLPVQPPVHGTLVLYPDGRFTYQPVIDFRGTDTFTYRICDKGTPSLCSTATVTILIGKDDNCAVFVPNSFSPNGDGIHDTFKVRCLYNYENPIIEIYNRWGNLVFKKDHYGDSDYWGSENDAWWTGRSDHKWTVGNDLLPVGTYYYVLKLNNSKVLTGFLFLNK